MKLVKSLLLGSAAGIAAVAGAQAADLPVKKAAPVEYVRVCTAYGAGFFYIPGTDTCIRIGGRARFEYQYTPTLNRNAGNGDVSGYRTIGRLNLDARTQTAYGTLRTFVRFDIASRTGAYLTSGTQQRFANAFPALGPDTFGRAQKFVDIDKAFVQFAGLTAGRAASFFDFYAGDFELIGNGAYSNQSSTNLLAYTATFGEGFTATISVEDPTFRRTPIFGGGSTTTGGVFAVNTAFNAFTGTTIQSPIYTVDAAGNRLDVLNDVTQKNRLPDFVGALRYDAPWGSAQLSAAVHEINGGLGNSVLNPVTGATGVLAPGLGVGRARNEYGFAVGAGIKVNTPFIAPGDALYLQGNYSEGGLSYTGITSPTAGEVLAAGVINGQWTPTLADATLNPVTGRFDLTQSFSVAGAFLHYWSPEWRSAAFGSYAEARYSKGARAGLGLTGFGVPATNTVAGANAFAFSPILRDFNIIYVGANLIWSPVRDLDIGVEGVYIREALNSGRTADVNRNVVTVAGVPTRTVSSADNALIRFRVQRDF